MDVSIAAAHLKEFAQALVCLGKVGHELSLVCGGDALHVRALNSAKSAFMAVRFSAFESLEGADFSCTILAKPVVTCLRSLRRVTRLRIYLEDDAGPEPHLVFQLIGAHGVVRCHRLTIGDGEVLHAMFDDAGASRFVTFSALLEHVHGTDELLAVVRPDTLRLKSYHNPAVAEARGGRSGGSGRPANLQKALQTEMSIAATEFDEYHYAGPPEGLQMVFCFREVKALMSFCDSVEADHLAMSFHAGSRPLQFAAQKDVLDVELIMSTMEGRQSASGGGGGVAAAEPTPSSMSNTG
uniref:Cell cycle checkpoint protein RAD1 n=1 Tax=Phaeomonas parva TaxID=124430 RepID=A0A6U4G219_9STRA|mmetsp:Transcript_27964/g.89096  ORF Transcript_27964/g.89096 Transcript_27964/m.89096 type:complete len:296 (+) Transcript_27964:308-1195(+)